MKIRKVVYVPIRNIEGDKKMVEAVSHVWREKNANTDKVSKKANRSNDNGQDTNHQRELENHSIVNKYVYVNTLDYFIRNH